MPNTTEQHPWVRRFLNEFGQYVAEREPVTFETLTRYREAQTDVCHVCGRRYVPDCNSGGCA